jgi:hypothetical protein
MRLRSILPILTVLLLSSIAAGCTPFRFGRPQLRIANTSRFALDRLVVIFPNERIVFGPIPAGVTTAYQPAEHGVYGYAAYEGVADGRVFQQPVIDWVGEQPLAGARFTYALSVDPQRDAWSIVQAEVRTDEHSPVSVVTIIPPHEQEQSSWR